MPLSQYVFTIPKLLRLHSRFDRRLLGLLSSCAYHSVLEMMREIAAEPDAVPGMLTFIHYGDDSRPLVEGGIKFTVSTDAHGTQCFKVPFKPEAYCSDLCITPENANAIIRELLAIRVKKSLQ